MPMLFNDVFQYISFDTEISPTVHALAFDL